jgi:hypothetical protein
MGERAGRREEQELCYLSQAPTDQDPSPMDRC